MKVYQFKTNIKCDNCINTVTPSLEKLNLDDWEVDLNSPERILTVRGQSEKEDVINALKEVGYEGELI